MAIMQIGTLLALKYGSEAMGTTSTDKPKQKGNIVVTSSCAILGGAFADMAYTAAKNGCDGLVRSGAVKLSSSNIRVNAVAPKGMEYQLEKIAEEIRNGSDTIYQRFGLGGDQRYYYNRSAAPEIANVAVFLASDLAIAISCQGEPRERTRIRPWECESMRKMHGP
ncbi:hypothetical protein N7527_009994 [Penicillium freii]|nr:hypothetical protein N7527_009994 [Penicillium freii]